MICSGEETLFLLVNCRWLCHCQAGRQLSEVATSLLQARSKATVASGIDEMHLANIRISTTILNVFTVQTPGRKTDQGPSAIAEVPSCHRVQSRRVEVPSKWILLRAHRLCTYEGRRSTLDGLPSM